VAICGRKPGERLGPDREAAAFATSICPFRTRASASSAATLPEKFAKHFDPLFAFFRSKLLFFRGRH
jgi:hypothetical protein